MNKTETKIIFIGTSQFAVPALEKLILNKYKIVGVITAIDKPVGRQQQLTSSPVKQTAQKHNLPVLQPEKISQAARQILALKPDLGILASYGQIIPQKILDIPKLGFINIHPSLLPKYRGPSPIQTAILNNDKKTGVSLMLIDEQMDHGPIIDQKSFKIPANDTYQDLEQKLAQISAGFLITTLPQYIKGRIKPQKQDHTKATYTKMLSRANGQINLSKNAKQIEQMVKAFYPWPGVFMLINNKRIKILKAKAADKQEPNSIKTGRGWLILKLVQPEGKKPMTGQEYFRGRRR